MGLCQECGFTISELADRTKADTKAVMAVIDGRNEYPSIDLIGEICLALGITMSEFFRHSLFDEV